MMSYAEKPEDITKEEWMEKLNNVHIQRADMNRLIMNYLVTGMYDSFAYAHIPVGVVHVHAWGKKTLYTAAEYDNLLPLIALQKYVN